MPSECTVFTAILASWREGILWEGGADVELVHLNVLSLRWADGAAQPWKPLLCCHEDQSSKSHRSHKKAGCGGVGGEGGRSLWAHRQSV